MARRRPWVVVAADDTGAYWDEPDFGALGRSGDEFREPRPDELTELPPGARVQFLPERVAVGHHRKRKEVERLKGRLAVAVQLPSGFTRTLLPAYRTRGQADYLPFFGYTAVVARGDKLYCAAVQTDTNPHWVPASYGGDELPARIERLQQQYPDNRVLKQLERCALEYGCYNAQNVFFNRWEGAVAVSPSCNAQCRGCISLQPEEFPPSPQERFHFVPTVDEIVEVGLHHLKGPDSIYSFGQGCEGEPLLQGERIADSIRRLRAETDLGSLHLNTNASLPDQVRRVVEAGLDSMRVSLNSVVAERYEAYYQPKRYRYQQLLESIRIARSNGVYVSLNLLMMPGWNDAPQEVEALLEMLEAEDVNMIQLRTLNIDPDLYTRFVPPPEGPALGVARLLELLREERPRVFLGNHSPAVRRGQVPSRPSRTSQARTDPEEHNFG